MPAKKKKGGKVQSGGSLLTLSQVSERTGISMPTLQRYKKNHQDRLPSVGEGRRQRYPKEALPVFEEIRRENISKRGRPKKSASGGGTGGRKKTGGAKKASKRTPPPKKPARQTRSSKGGAKKKTQRKTSAASSGLLTLTEVEKRTGISYPTLVRYVRLHGDKIPHEGEGRRRRYHPEAVEVFKELRGQSRRGGGRKKSKASAKASKTTRRTTKRSSRKASSSADSDDRMQALESAVQGLQKTIDTLSTKLQGIFR